MLYHYLQNTSFVRRTLSTFRSIGDRTFGIIILLYFLCFHFRCWWRTNKMRTKNVTSACLLVCPFTYLFGFPTLKFIDNYIEITKMRRQKKNSTTEFPKRIAHKLQHVCVRKSLPSIQFNGRLVCWAVGILVLESKLNVIFIIYFYFLVFSLVLLIRSSQLAARSTQHSPLGWWVSECLFIHTKERRKKKQKIGGTQRIKNIAIAISCAQCAHILFTMRRWVHGVRECAQLVAKKVSL